MDAGIHDLLSMPGVQGVLFFAPSGELAAEAWTASRPAQLVPHILFRHVAGAANGGVDLDLVFRKGRVLVRQDAAGYLVVVLAPCPSAARVRMQMAITPPTLGAPPPRRRLSGLLRFF